MSLKGTAWASLACVALSGCMTQQAYDGPRRDRDDVAHVSGDFRITAGAPVTITLRQVDGHTLGLNEYAVEVLEGEHQFLVDCRIAETGGVSRHSVTAFVSAGHKYRFSAETGPALRHCTEVTVQSND
jgi:hypothetical protein